MRRLLLLALTASLVALSGCTTSRPRSSTTGAGGSLPPEPFVGSPSAPEKEAAGSLAKRPTGTLAGQVLEPSRRRVAHASIQVTPLDESGKKARFSVRSDGQGYFDIPSLEAGRRYHLVATSKRGDQTWSGRVTVTASDVRIAIWLTEIRPSAAEATPAKADDPLLAAPENPRPCPPADRMAQDKEKRDFDLGRPPATATIPGPGRELGENPSRKPSLPPAPIRSEGGTTTPLPGASPAPPTPAPPDSEPEPFSKAEVPSCVRAGLVVHNFALKDFDGQDWELRQRCKGKLVLVDFWSLSCRPCIDSLPKLVDLQRRWGDKGLQVVGVLCDEGDLATRKRRILASAASRGTRFNYPVVFSESAECPVRRKFEVFAYPTLRLLDAKGRIIWEAQGFAEHTAISLDRELSRRLGS